MSVFSNNPGIFAKYTCRPWVICSGVAWAGPQGRLPRVQNSLGAQNLKRKFVVEGTQEVLLIHRLGGAIHALPRALATHATPLVICPYHVGKSSLFFNRFQTVSGTHFDYWTKMLRGLFEVQNGGAASIVKFRKAFFKTVLKWRNRSYMVYSCPE